MDGQPFSDSLRPGVAILRTLPQQSGLAPDYPLVPSPPSWNPAQPGKFGIQAGFGSLGGANFSYQANAIRADDEPPPGVP